ncbi:MAG: hypothetical protein ACJ764_00535 [Solirubrobacteraceae bacterium]
MPLAGASAGVAAAGAAGRSIRRRRRRSSGLRRLWLPNRKGPLEKVRDRTSQALEAKLRDARGVGQALHQRAESLSGADGVPRRQELLWLAAANAGVYSTAAIRRARRLPIQQSIDIAVPLEVAYDEWMKLEFLPEGSHRVRNIERDGDTLTGRVGARAWEAELLDERDCDSFAWRSVKGTDCAGLVTFHRLDERLTRLELQLDIAPRRPLDAAEFALHLADARARADLRRFKARLETMSPDAYRSGDDEDDDEDQDEDGAGNDNGDEDGDDR